MMNLERPTMDGCGQQQQQQQQQQQPALFITGNSGASASGDISGPQEQPPVHQSAIPTEHYGAPLSLSVCISDSGHEILRPKPRSAVTTKNRLALGNRPTQCNKSLR